MRDFGRLVDTGVKHRRRVAPYYRALSRDLNRALEKVRALRSRIDAIDGATRRFFASATALPSVGLLGALAPAEDALQKLHTDVTRRARDWSPPGVDERFSHYNVLLYLRKHQDMDSKRFTDARITSIMISLGLERGPHRKALSRVRSALNRLAASRS